MRPIAAALLLAAALPARAQGPLTLDDALAEASRTSADLRLAGADLSVARADRTSALSELLPRLDLSASFGRAFQGPTSARTVVIGGFTQQIPAQPASDSEQYAASLQLRQTLFDWRTFHDLSASGWSARGTGQLYDDVVLSLSFEVTRRFYDLARAQRALGVLEQTATRSQELVDRADALFTAGRSPKSETYSARVNLQNDRLAVDRQRVTVDRARTSLAQVLGRPMAEPIEVVPPVGLEAPRLPSESLPGVDELVALARERRPSIAAQRSFVEAAQAGVSSAQAGYLPTVSLQGGYTRSGQSLFGSEGVYGDPSRGYDASALLVLSWNIFEGRATSARVARAEGTLERARANADRTDTDLAKEIADARTAVTALARQIALASENLGIAREALALATGRLEAGLASQLELRDANLKLTQAELTLLETRIDHAVAIAALARAVGGAL
jgi:outer membrane protein